MARCRDSIDRSQGSSWGTVGLKVPQGSFHRDKT